MSELVPRIENAGNGEPIAVLRDDTKFAPKDLNKAVASAPTALYRALLLSKDVTRDQSLPQENQEV
jgi:hypothetical protein